MVFQPLLKGSVVHPEERQTHSIQDELQHLSTQSEGQEAFTIV